MNKLPELQKASQLYKKYKISWILKIAVTLFFVYLVNKNLGYQRVRLIGIHLTSIPIALVLLCGIANFLFQVARWRLVCEGYGIRISARVAFKTMLFGNLLAFVTPGKFGELLRGVSIPEAKKADAVAAAVFEKACAGAVTVIFGVCAAAIHGLLYGMSAAQTVIIAGTLGLAAASGICAFLVVKARAHTLPIHQKLQKAVLFVDRFVPKINAGTSWIIAGYSIAAHIFLICQTVLLFAMFGSSDVAADIIGASQAYAFMIFFPFFIANMGIREYSFSLILGEINSVKTTLLSIGTVALLSSVSVLAINMALPALAGLVWWYFDSKSGMILPKKS